MPVDYFGTYFTDRGFDLTRLLNDDFFQPIRILYRSKHYVSAIKLLVVAIDSVSNIEYGDVPGSFVRWLNQYADLAKLGIAAEELWEQRNSLLHMSNLDSRKVRAGSVRRLMAYVGDLPSGVNLKQDGISYYNLQHLIIEFGHACGRWAETYNQDRSKIDSFVERYDLIASDARMLWIPIKGST